MKKTIEKNVKQEKQSRRFLPYIVVVLLAVVITIIGIVQRYSWYDWYYVVADGGVFAIEMIIAVFLVTKHIKTLKSKSINGIFTYGLIVLNVILIFLRIVTLVKESYESYWWWSNFTDILEKGLVFNAYLLVSIFISFWNVWIASLYKMTFMEKALLVIHDFITMGYDVFVWPFNSLCFDYHIGLWLIALLFVIGCNIYFLMIRRMKMEKKNRKQANSILFDDSETEENND